MASALFIRRVLLARLVVSAAALVLSLISPQLQARWLVVGVSGWATVSSVVLLLTSANRPRAAAFVIVVCDMLALAAVRSAGAPGTDIAFAWPVLIVAFILGPSWSFPTALTSALVMLVTDLLQHTKPARTDTVVGPFLMIAAFGYVVGRFAFLQIQTQRDRDAISRRYRDIFEGAPDGILLLDDNLEIVDANPAAQRMFEECDGWPLTDNNTLRDGLHRLLSTPGERLTLDRVDRDGTPRTFSITVSQRRSSDEHASGYVANFRDATTLRRRTQHLHRLAEVATEVSACGDSEDVLSLSVESARELLESDVAWVVSVGHSDCEILTETGLPDWLRGYRYPHGQDASFAAHSSGEPQQVRRDSDQGGHPLLSTLGVTASLTVPLPAGSPLPAVLSVGRVGPGARSYSEDDVRILQSLVAHTAVALEKGLVLARERRLREDLTYANELKDQFLTTVSHELRTPLTVMNGVLETVLRSASLTEASKDDLLRRAAAQGDRLQRLIERLLDMSRASGRHDTAIRACHLPSIVAQVVAMSPHHGLCRLDVDDLAILADPDDLQIVLHNLIDNSAKYGASTLIVITARATDSRVHLSIEDAGPGVPEGQREQLFERFVRGHNTERTPGLGVGLAIVKELLAQMNGTVRYEQRDPSGARFVIELQLAVPQLRSVS